MTHSFYINMFTALKGYQFQLSFAITAAGVVPCGGPKKSPRTLSIVHSADYIFLSVLRDLRRYSEKSKKYYRFRFIF